MDLKEISVFTGIRHPYETARINSIKKIISPYLREKQKLDVLDAGCGDGFVSSSLFYRMDASITGVDVNLSKELTTNLPRYHDSFTFNGDYKELGDRKYDIVLALDMLEHEKNDKELLLMMVKKHLRDDGIFLVIVPAFNFLFSDYDRFYHHYRRYDRKDLLLLVESCELKAVSSGYLFATLLCVRFFSNIANNFFFSRNTMKFKRLGEWNKGYFVSRFFELLLNFENNSLLYLAKKNIRLPGLSVWALCRKRK